YNQLNNPVAQYGNQRYADQHRGNGLNDIDKAHDHVVYSASEIGGNHAQKSAYKQTHYRAGDPNGQGIAGSINHPAEQIPPQVVRAEGMFSTWRLENGLVILGAKIVGGNDRG